MMFARTLAAAAVAGLAFTFAAHAEAGGKDIVQTAKDAGNFETLLTAAEAAGLVATLQGPGPLTVFAPTDAAFAALPEGTVEMLLKPENKDRLVEILTWHVVPGKVMAADLSEGMKAKTAQGGELTVTMEGGPKVNGAAISTADIVASNGVIHVIDEVILPPKN